MNRPHPTSTTAAAAGKPGSGSARTGSSSARTTRRPRAGDARKVVVENRRARHEYEIVEQFDAGMALVGTEVKSLRDGGGDMRDAYVVVRGGQALLVGLHIAPYGKGNINNHEPGRTRTLLLHRREIAKIDALVSRKGLTIVPLNIYFERGIAKISIGVARGKHTIDKRRDISARDIQRQVQRELKERSRDY